MSATAVADLAVVGGGVLGSFVAYTAARDHPDWRVLLLERTAIGAGATAWSAGVSFPLAATPRHRELVRASAAGYAKLHDTAAGAFLRPVQMIYVTRRDGLEQLRGRVVDAPLRPVSVAELQRVRDMLPDVRLSADDEVVTHDGHGFVVQARLLAEALVAAVAGQTEIQLGQHVRSAEPDDVGYRLIGERGAWSARRLVLAPGPWAPPALASTPLPALAGARRKRIAALCLRLPVTPLDPLVYFLDDDLFVLPSTNGTALVSFYRDEWDTDPDTCDGRPSADDLRLGVAALAARSPAAARAVTGGQAFCDLYTEHRLPVVTIGAGAPGLAAIRGGSGSGVRLAPALAAQALDAVCPPASGPPASGPPASGPPASGRTTQPRPSG